MCAAAERRSFFVTARSFCSTCSRWSRTSFCGSLSPEFKAAAEPEAEQITVRIDPEAKEVLEGNTVILKDTGTERLEIVADILSKSVVLARYESTVAQTFDRIEPFAGRADQAKHRQPDGPRAAVAPGQCAA